MFVGENLRSGPSRSTAAKLAAIVALAGYGAAYLHYDFPFRPFEKPVQAPPKTLPPAVQSRQASVIKLSNEYSGYDGSGVKIASNLALTAGHMVVNDKNGQPVPSCLSGQNEHSTSKSSTDLVTGWYTSYKGQNRQNPDIALLKVRHNRSFDRLPTTPIASSTAKKGELVYFINYEYGPNEPADANYDHPTEYAGVVIGHYGSALEVANGLQSYGPLQGKEDDTYTGASGGAVDNGNGELIGLSVDILNYPIFGKEIRAQFIDDEHLLHLPVADSAAIGLALVQPVTTAMVRHDRPLIHDQAIC